MVEKGYKAISVKKNIAVNIQQRAKKEGKNITDLLNELLNREGITTTLEEVHEAKKELTKGEIKTIIDKAIKGLENDISVLVRDAVKDAFAEMKGY